MREIVYTASFRKDYKRLSRSGRHDLNLLKEILAMLAHDIPLPGRNCDHALSGDWDGCRECHIKPDWLLIYVVAPGELVLLRSGSHAELFG